MSAADKPTPCAMYTQEPYPFAWCETHDETFALGEVCPHYTKEMAFGATLITQHETEQEEADDE